MKLADLSERDFTRRLQTTGIVLRTGPFVYRVRSELPDLAAPLRLLYGESAFIESSSFADFHLYVNVLRPLRSVFAKRVQIVVEGLFSSNPAPCGQALAHFEWTLNRCLYAQADRYLLLHSASLERAGSGILISGASGAGKSTLTAGLSVRGWRVLSDELALVDPSTGQLAAVARPVILKNETISLLRTFASASAIGPSSPGTLKGTIAHLKASAETVARVDEVATPRFILFIRYDRGAAVRFEPIGKAQALYRLAKDAFNYGLLEGSGFRTLADMVEQCDCHEFSYGDLDGAVAAVNSLVGSAACAHAGGG